MKRKSVPATIKPNGTLLHLLPLTEGDLDAFVQSLTEEYGLPPGDGTYEAIASAIVHMPANQAYAPRMHFGHIGLKQMATTVAYAKVAEFNEKRRKAREAEQKKGVLAAGAVAPDGKPVQDS